MGSCKAIGGYHDRGVPPYSLEPPECTFQQPCLLTVGGKTISVLLLGSLIDRNSSTVLSPPHTTLTSQTFDNISVIIWFLKGLLIKADKLEDPFDQLSFIKAIDCILKNKEKKSLQIIEKKTE